MFSVFNFYYGLKIGHILQFAWKSTNTNNGVKYL